MRPNYVIPLSIVIAGALIAGAVFLVSKNSSPQAPMQGSGSAVRPVDPSDHLLGNPSAPIVIIEYSDLECPYCKSFHDTMHKIIDEYGTKGQVAWVYRHFPLTALHPKAAKEAEASECAAELAGNAAFWRFVDRLYEITPSNNGLDLARLPVIAEETGLNRAAFELCLSSGKYADKVKAGFDEAIALGAQGTPHNILAVGGSYLILEGAQPLSSMRAAIETLLQELGRNIATTTP